MSLTWKTAKCEFQCKKRGGKKGPEEVLAESFKAAQQPSTKQNSGQSEKKNTKKKTDCP